MSSSTSPCAACKFLRRKCTQGCVFAPYFPPDNPARFVHVHRVFGASNVSKLLSDLTPEQREDAVNTLAYEAEARLRDPVYGCVGYISLLQHRLLQLQRDLSAAKMELSTYVGPAALAPFGFHNQFCASSSWPPPLYREQQQQQHHHHRHHQEQQMVEAQQLAEAFEAARENLLMRSVEQQHEMARLMGNGNGVGASATAMAEASPHIGGFEDSYTELRQQEEGEFQEGSGLHLHHNHHQRRSFDDGRNGAGPSS